MKRLRTNCFCHAGTELATAPRTIYGPSLDGRKLRGSAYCQYLLLSVIVHTYRWSVKINDAHKCAHIVNEKGVNDRLRIDFVLTSFFKTIRYCKTIVLRKQNVMLFFDCYSSLQPLWFGGRSGINYQASLYQKLNLY